MARDIRSREIRSQKYTRDQLQLQEIQYTTSVSTEYFLQFVLADTNKIVAFLRLSLPTQQPFITELQDSAIIREVHVYGELVKLGNRNTQKAQHQGLGSELIERAKNIAKNASFKRISVISATGTREYYRKRGFENGELYQSMELI